MPINSKTSRPVWDFSGPDFGLTLELGPAGDRPRIARVANAFWDNHLVAGPWKERTSADDLTARRTIGSDSFVCKSLYGLLSIANSSAALPFVAHQISDGEQRRAFGVAVGPEASDWFSIGIPVSILRQFYPVDGSWRLASQPWLSDVCAAFADLANTVHSQSPIAAGAIGEEISGCWRSPTAARARDEIPEYPPLALMSADAIDKRGGFLVPSVLRMELKPLATPVALSSGLNYFPPKPNAALLGA